MTDKEALAAYREARRKAFVELAVQIAGARWQLPLAEPLGVSQGLLSQISTGRRHVTDDMLLRLAQHATAVGKSFAERSKTIKEKAEAIWDDHLKANFARKVAAKSFPDQAPQPEPELEPDDDPAPTMTHR